MKLKGINCRSHRFSLTTTIAIAALALSVFNTIVAYHRPMSMSIEVLGFIGPQKDISNPTVAAHMVFSNVGKRNIAVVGAFLEIQNPSDSNEVIIESWVGGIRGESALPTIVPAEQPLLKTILFEGPPTYELERIASRNKAKEIEATIIVTVVNKHGNLMDIRFNAIRFLLDSQGKYLGYSFDTKISTATLKDAFAGSSIMHRISPESYVGS